MRLTVFTDHAVRVLVYLGQHPERFVTIPEIAGAYGISANHLMKVAQHLAARGDVVTLRGPRGGLRLARPAEAIRIGDVVRASERALGPVTCEGVAVFGPVLEEATAAFLAVLDGCSVADLVGDAVAGVPSGGTWPRADRRSPDPR
jgi:Rrf2 family nitric oxide-sensitive transcriptional repressor